MFDLPMLPEHLSSLPELFFHGTSCVSFVALLLWYHVTSGIALVELLMWYHVTRGVAIDDLLL